MANIILNAMGEQCPIPVVKATKALRELTETGTLEVLVDNETHMPRSWTGCIFPTLHKGCHYFHRGLLKLLVGPSFGLLGLVFCRRSSLLIPWIATVSGISC